MVESEITLQKTLWIFLKNIYRPVSQMNSFGPRKKSINHSGILFVSPYLNLIVNNFCDFSVCFIHRRRHKYTTEHGFPTWGTFAYLKGYIHYTAATNKLET